MLQNLLKGIQLWYKFQSVLDETFQRHALHFELDIFLLVLPQLFSKRSDFVNLLLVRLGAAFPQQLAIPLACAAEQEDAGRASVARSILCQMRRERPGLLGEIGDFQKELVRVATLRAEYALDGLYRAI